MISLEKYKTISAILEKKTHEIWKHENEERLKKHEQELNGYENGYSIADCYSVKEGDSTIYFAFNFSFIKLISVRIPQAIDRLNYLFGTGNANDVLNAIYQVSQTEFEKDEYIEYIRNLSCCYIIFEKHDGIQDSILRVDMFRQLDNNKSNPFVKDFTGGLLHALKHFSINGYNLSTGKEVNETTDISNISNILPRIASAFIECINSNSSSVTIPYKDNNYMKCGFYHELITNVYYLNTCFITDKDK